MFGAWLNLQQRIKRKERKKHFKKMAAMRTHIIRFLMLLGLFFSSLVHADTGNVTVYGVADVSYDSTAPHAISDFAGTYSGTFSGGASGTWSATISPSGVITATAFSNSTLNTFSGSGQIQINGSLSMTLGSFSNGATYNGTLNFSTGALSGTWINSYAGLSGTWTGSGISDARVFAFAEANYPTLFAGTPVKGQYFQYHYRYYPGSGNYLAVDTNGEIFILGPYSGNVITSVGMVSVYANLITAWEAARGH